MIVPACLLCHKRLYKGDEKVVTFANHVQPEDLMCEEPPGFECFCNEHLVAAQALSHLTSQEALLQLQQQFGTLERPVCRRATAADEVAAVLRVVLEQDLTTKAQRDTHQPVVCQVSKPL
jgi:hypothetical protein